MDEKSPDPEPDAEPAGPPPDRPRRRRARWVGIGVGIAAHAAFMAVDVVEMSGPDDDYRGLAYAILAVIGTPVLLLAGGLGTIWPASRQFGIGLLIGTGAGLVIFGGVCVAILSTGG